MMFNKVSLQHTHTHTHQRQKGAKANVERLIGKPRYCILFFFLNMYLFLRETQSVSGEGAEREGDTGSEAGSRL